MKCGPRFIIDSNAS